MVRELYAQEVEIDDGFVLEDGTGVLVLEEATDIVMNNYLRVGGEGRLSVATNG